MMTTWAEIEARRTALGLSRARMCRLANVSESTVWKGLKTGTPPQPVISDRLAAVLADYLNRLQSALAKMDAA